MGFLDTALGAADTLTGGFLSGAGDYYYNKKLTERSHGFTKEMMQNKSQWAVQDLKKAGLNPILAATGGMGAPNIGNSASSSVKTNPVALAQVRLMGEQKKLTKEQQETEKTKQTANSAAATKAIQDAFVAEQSAQNVAVDTQLKSVQRDTLMEKYVREKNLANVERSDVGKMMAYADRLGINPGHLVNILVGTIGAAAVARMLPKTLGTPMYNAIKKYLNSRGNK
jgi:hypothetical protein